MELPEQKNDSQTLFICYKAIMTGLLNRVNEDIKQYSNRKNKKGKNTIDTPHFIYAQKKVELLIKYLKSVISNSEDPQAMIKILQDYHKNNKSYFNPLKLRELYSSKKVFTAKLSDPTFLNSLNRPLSDCDIDSLILKPRTLNF